MSKFVFVTGGVVSSIGKGIVAASLGRLLKSRGYSVSILKLDPYLNVDPGTMSPFQHGEVFVTEDGAETDLDLGHYERFTDTAMTRLNSVTTGSIYQAVINKERRGNYNGGTVQVIPHITGEIRERIHRVAANSNADIIITEIGGTVGDIESLPFLEAIREFKNDVNRNDVAYIHVTLLPYIKTSGEIKTKPTQHSVKELRSIGIQPDVLLCRSEKRIDKSDIKKIAIFCNVSEKSVIQATDVKTIYEIPKIYMQNGFDTEVLASMNIKKPRKINLRKWNKVVHSVNNPKGQVNIGVIGKYVGLKDAYKSLSEALTHGGIANDISVKIHWIDSEKIKTKKDTKLLKSMSGILIPGGFGKRGSEGKILAINYARTNKIPFFGICFGMQLAVIEAARNLAKIDNANSSELSNTKNPVIGLMTEWEKNDKKFLRDSNSEYGGTMRLGSYPAILNKKSLSYKIYKTKKINERHRHRYEVNINYKEKLEQIGLNFSGISPDGLLPEIVEIKNHPWFVGVQFHPELKSRPFDPHPLFSSFIKASIKESINKK